MVPDASSARRAVVLVALSLTFGLVQLDATIVNVALDAVGRDLGGGIGFSQWLVDAYAVPFAALLLVAGAVGDRFGHRCTCVAGFAVFALASVPAALASSWSLLIAARAIQGVGAALMLPASLALVGELYPERRARARALGVWGGVATLGFAAGPLVGGLLVTGWGWPAIFWLNVPVAAGVGTTVALLAPPDRRQVRRFDVAGGALAAATLALSVAGTIRAGQGGWASSVSLLALAVVLAVVFTVVERLRRDPLVPAEVARVSSLRCSLLVGFGFNFAMYGGLLVATLTLQSEHGFSPLAGGIAVLPMAVVVFVGATASGFLTARFGPRKPMVVGLVLGACGGAVSAVGGTSSAPAWVITGLAISGLISLAMPAMTSVALGAVDAPRAGLASGALNTARQMGGALGVAVLGALLNALGYRTGLLAAGVLICLTLLASCVAASAATRAVAT